MEENVERLGHFSEEIRLRPWACFHRKNGPKTSSWASCCLLLWTYMLVETFLSQKGTQFSHKNYVRSKGAPTPWRGKRGICSTFFYFLGGGGLRKDGGDCCCSFAISANTAHTRTPSEEKGKKRKAEKYFAERRYTWSRWVRQKKVGPRITMDRRQGKFHKKTYKCFIAAFLLLYLSKPFCCHERNMKKRQKWLKGNQNQFLNATL